MQVIPDPQHCSVNPNPNANLISIQKSINKIICTQKSCNWDWTVQLGPKSKTEAPASNLVALLKSR